jgi:chloramphenicol-sensitive protein RarD
MNQNQSEYRKGVMHILLCMLLWGVLPIYWKSLVPISSWVIIVYRILLVFVMAVLFALRNHTWQEIWAPLKEDRKTVKTLAIAGFIITANWSTYIWAVNAGYILQASLGYYIEPLAVCLFGIVLFHEQVTKYKLTAMLFAVAAVVLIILHFGQVPGVALGLVVTFSVYSAIKRSITIDPELSMIYETMWLAPFALVVAIYLEVTGKGALAAGEPYQYGLLMLCGLFTVVPLILFASAAQKTSMFVLGLAEYINPTLQLLIGVFVYHETLDLVQLGAFGIIWIGLVFFTYGELKGYKTSANENQ